MIPDEIREFFESPIEQGINEVIAYRFYTTPWGTAPSAGSAKIYDPEGVDVTSTNLSGIVVIAGDLFTTPAVTGLLKNKTYRLAVKFTCSGNIFEPYAQIVAKE